ncbi:MAG: glycosyltransferase family 4 protein [Deltaproteobacteria bacterium]
MSEQALRVGLLTYRGNPRCGGQGVYIRLLARELRRMGHQVDVWSGQPYPELTDGVGLKEVPSMDLWKDRHGAGMRLPRLKELRDPINRAEYTDTLLGGFPEPITFCDRVAREFRTNGARDAYDVIHDNQCLGPGLLEVAGYVPLVATIHHPITRDRRIALGATRNPFKKYGLKRWYGFIPKQVEVARKLDNIITISEAAATDIADEFEIERGRIRNIGNGIDLELFRPMAGVERDPNMLMTTLSADAPLKGFRFLADALAELLRKRPQLELTVIGSPLPKTRTAEYVRDLGLSDAIHFTGRVPGTRIVELYARSSLAIVPSLYEGFGFPAGEAMACEVPVVSTIAGGLPEVVGPDGECGSLVQPGSATALATAIDELLGAPEKRRKMGRAGRRRVEELFGWRAVAGRTVDAYRTAIDRWQGPC